MNLISLSLKYLVQHYYVAHCPFPDDLQYLIHKIFQELDLSSVVIHILAIRFTVHYCFYYFIYHGGLMITVLGQVDQVQIRSEPLILNCLYNNEEPLDKGAVVAQSV
jgi:hypothetical protein